MKKILLIVLSLFLIVGCSSDKDTSSSQARELIDGSTLENGKDGRLYAPGSDKPYSGDAVWHFNSEVNRKEGTFKNGVPDGVWTKWYSNGQKCEEGTVKDGKLDGVGTEWWKNGQKRYEVTYKDGEWISEKCWNQYGNEIDCG